MYGLKNVRNRRDDELSRVGWDRLESLLAVYYRGQGWLVEHVGTARSGSRFDGGIDLKLRRGTEYVLVQCKHWNAKQVPHNEVHQLLGIMVNEGATGAILVSSGEFTRAAIDAAQRQGRVQLIDGDALREMLGPLPEPEETSGEVAATTRAIAAHVGDRLLRAAEDRVLGRRDAKGHRSMVSAGWTFLLLKTVLPLAIGGAFLVVAIGFIQRTLAGMQAPATRPVQAAPLPLPSAPVNRPVTGMPAHARVQAPATIGRQSTNPCHEIIDWQTGTYIDHCARTSPRKPPTEAEIRESKRKADDAMKVLEASTPEV